MHFICHIDKEIYKVVTPDITTDEVIITEKQILHIIDHHPEAFDKIIYFVKDAIRQPDRDNPSYKNSVISCWQISERRLSNYLQQIRNEVN